MSAERLTEVRRWLHHLEELQKAYLAWHQVDRELFSVLGVLRSLWRMKPEIWNSYRGTAGRLERQVSTNRRTFLEGLSGGAEDELAAQVTDGFAQALSATLDRLERYCRWRKRVLQRANGVDSTREGAALSRYRLKRRDLRSRYIDLSRLKSWLEVHAKFLHRIDLAVGRVGDSDRNRAVLEVLDELRGREMRLHDSVYSVRGFFSWSSFRHPGGWRWKAAELRMIYECAGAIVAALRRGAGEEVEALATVAEGFMDQVQQLERIFVWNQEALDSRRQYGMRAGAEHLRAYLAARNRTNALWDQMSGRLDDASPAAWARQGRWRS